MKKIAQLALLVSIASLTTTYCWEWSDLVPTRLYSWYNQHKLYVSQRNQEMRRKEYIAAQTILKQKEADLLNTNTPQSRATYLDLVDARDASKKKYDKAYWDYYDKRNPTHYPTEQKELQQKRILNWQQRWRSYKAAPKSASKAIKGLESRGLGYQ